ncbi:MAG TPA: hypothetical protein VMI06_02875 [Terriglobia bacterium]|nr:hypothetical protein [Terriglobia bacterium]
MSRRHRSRRLAQSANSATLQAGDSMTVRTDLPPTAPHAPHLLLESGGIGLEQAAQQEYADYNDPNASL